MFIVSAAAVEGIARNLPIWPPELPDCCRLASTLLTAATRTMQSLHFAIPPPRWSPSSSGVRRRSASRAFAPARGVLVDGNGVNLRQRQCGRNSSLDCLPWQFNVAPPRGRHEIGRPNPPAPMSQQFFGVAVLSSNPIYCVFMHPALCALDAQPGLRKRERASL
jgi:hypothetical protein